MADGLGLGLLEGLASGVKEGLSAYQIARKNRLEEEKIRRDQQVQDAQLKSQGYEIGESGAITPGKTLQGKLSFEESLYNPEDPVAQQSAVLGKQAAGLLGIQGYAPEGLNFAQQERLQKMLEPYAKAKQHQDSLNERASRGASGYKGFKDQFGSSNELRKEWSNHPVTKNTDSISQAYAKIDQASKGTSATDNMSMIFGFMKLQDPTSTVREGEYASAENAKGIPDTVRNLYNKTLKGTILTEQQKQNFLKSAQGIYQAQLDQQKQIDDEYNSLANQMGADPGLVVRKRSGFLQDNNGLIPKISAEDQQALEWANSNPKDPRALEIKKRLGQ